MFELDPQLAKDSIVVTDLSLCRVLLANDCQYPWLILVPMRENITEIIDLSAEDQQLLWRESAFIAQLMRDCFQPNKLNIAALGNMVPQLHLHHVARYHTDIAWPKPIWGQHDAIAYPPAQAQQLVADLVEKIEAGLN